MVLAQKAKIAFIALVVSALSFLVIFSGVIAVYIGISYQQRNDAPASWNIRVMQDQAPGKAIQVNIYDLNRFKLCPYRRYVVVTDSENKSWNLGDIPGYPPFLYGKNPDINFFVNLDTRTAPGSATLRITIEYSCAGNFFHAVLNEPVVISKTVAFNVLKPSGE